MGKMKPPSGDSPVSSPVMPAARGIAAYKKAMNGGATEESYNLKVPVEDGLLKTGEPPKKVPPKKAKTSGTFLRKVPEKVKKTEQARASKYKRAARFMVLVGSDEASKILSRLPSDQVEAISKEIVSIKSISPEEAESVLEEFRALLSPTFGYSGSSSGGVEEARRHLYAAFGPEKGEALLVKAVPAAAENPFDFLEDFSGEQLALLFRNESPAACAMVFSRLPSKLSAETLASTTPARKLEIVRRIARLNETSPEVIERTAAALREKARHFGRSDAAGGEIDGKGVLAAILKHSDISFGGRLLEEMEAEYPSLSREMKDRLYTLEDVAGAADRPIQEKLRGMNDREIALLLRGRSEAFIQKIEKNLSAARAGRIKEESEIMGPASKIEASAAAREFLAWFRLNREEGRILMLNDEDVLV
jgi:flagellar motor switch protein FliG